MNKILSPLIFPPVLFGFVFLFSFACRAVSPSSISIVSPTPTPQIIEIKSPEIRKVLESLTEQTKITKNYDPAYVLLKYPNGDVPVETGVCTDVVVRSFRKAGVDLQKEVHEDMAKDFAAYPTKWGLPAPDTNIDHRRVPNLQTFFTRRGKAVSMSKQASDYLPGDVVAWDLDGKGMTHIGVVSDIWNVRTKRFSIIHNIGGGVKAEDVLFDWKIIGHYRYF